MNRAQGCATKAEFSESFEAIDFNIQSVEQALEHRNLAYKIIFNYFTQKSFK